MSGRREPAGLIARHRIASSDRSGHRGRHDSRGRRVLFPARQPPPRMRHGRPSCARDYPGQQESQGRDAQPPHDGCRRVRLLVSQRRRRTQFASCRLHSHTVRRVTTAAHAGATVVLDRLYPRAVIDTMQRERVTGFPLVPTIATLLLQQDLQKHQFPNLRYITSAAAALPVDKIQRLRDAFPGVKVYSMYGQTECQRACYLPPDRIGSRPLSVGVAIPGSEAFVVTEQGHPAVRCEVGELVVRGPHVMRGYWRQPEATAKVLRQSAGGEAELSTGDLFTTDEDGFLYFVGRKDDMINTRGEKVSPARSKQLPGYRAWPKSLPTAFR